ncbi:ankyrin repeat domain-containing protein, partial [bacterium]|nr:ankyrin repeat domain-containing protein [bacterium]
MNDNLGYHLTRVRPHSPFVCRLAACVVLVIPMATAFSEGITTLALIPAGNEHAPSSAVLNRLEAAWIQQKDVSLVERQELEKILAEHQLTVTELTDAKSRVRLGQFVPADLLVFLDSIPKLPQPATRVQVTESKTGIVMASQILENDALLGDQQPALDLVRAAMAKQAVPVQDRHLLGYLEFRSEESGPMLDGIAAALGTLVITDLARAPHIVVLEREHLEHLRTERELTRLEQDLRTSVRLLEGGVRRGVETNQLAVTVALRPLAGGKPLLVKLIVPADDVIAAERLIAEEVAGLLKTKRAEPAGADRVTEAKVFDRQSALWSAWGDRHRSIRAAETAYALVPSQTHRLLVARMLTEGQTSLPEVVRANELLLDYYQLQAQAVASGAETNLALPTVGYVMEPPSRSDSSAQRQLRQQLDDLEERVFRFQLAHYRAHYERMAAAFWQAWTARLELLVPYSSGNRQRQTALVREAYATFLKPPAPPELMNGEPLQMLWQIPRAASVPNWWWPGRRVSFSAVERRNGQPFTDPELARTVCEPLLKEFIQQPDPYVRLVGYAGLQQYSRERSPDGRTGRKDRIKFHQEILRIMAEEIPVGHPYRTARHGYWGPACYGESLLLQACVGLELFESEQELPKDLIPRELDLYVRILRDLISTGDPERIATMESTGSLHLRWLEQLDKHGRLTEALELARGMSGVLKGRPVHNSGVYPALLKRQQLYEQLLQRERPPPAAKPALAGNGPEWDDYEILQLDLGIVLTKSSLNSSRSSLLMTSDGNRLYCVRPVLATGVETRRGRGQAVVNLQLTTHWLPTGSMLNRIDVDTEIPLRGDDSNYQARYLRTIYAIAHGEDTVYVGTSHGLAVIALKTRQGKLITPQEGLPGHIVRALAWYRGQLYLAIGCDPYQSDIDDQSLLAVLDPATRRFTIIASEKAVASGNPWDGTKFYVDDIVPDEASGCLWLKDRVTGIWKYTPATRTLENVVRPVRWIMVAGSRFVGTQPSYDGASVWSWGRVTVFAPPDLSPRPTPATLAGYHLVTQSLAVVIDDDTMMGAARGSTHGDHDRRLLFLQRPGKDPALLTVTPDGKPFPGALHLYATAAGTVAVAEDGQGFLLRRKGKKQAYRRAELQAASGNDQETTLLDAAEAGQLDKLESLLAAGVNINAVDRRGWA